MLLSIVGCGSDCSIFRCIHYSYSHIELYNVYNIKNECWVPFLHFMIKRVYYEYVARIWTYILNLRIDSTIFQIAMKTRTHIHNTCISCWWRLNEPFYYTTSSSVRIDVVYQSAVFSIENQTFCCHHSWVCLPSIHCCCSCLSPFRSYVDQCKTILDLLLHWLLPHPSPSFQYRSIQIMLSFLV